MILDGKIIAKKINEETRNIIANTEKTPKLVTVSVDPDDSTMAYINSQGKNASKLGIDFEHINLSGADTKMLLAKIHELNIDGNVDGIMISHPLPSEIDELEALKALSPEKDIEGRTPANIGLIVYEKPYFYPCTAEAVMEMLDYYSIPTKGKNAVIIGRSSTVGKPLALMMLQRKHNATPRVCHTGTENMNGNIISADILVVAAGKYGIVNTEDISQDTVVLDVGINFVEGKLVGDVKRDEKLEEERNISISPVPRGVGTVTTAILMRNVALNCRRV